MRLAPKFVIAIILFSLLALPLNASVTTADEIVNFPDPNLQEAILEAIGKSAPPIYQSELDGLTVLTAPGKGITDLTGLEHCTSLTRLTLAENQIGNISALSNLTSLTRLWASVNQISDISPLSNLTNLVHLELYQNDISDISPLANLTGLGYLWLQWNQIGNISILSNFTNLFELDISSNQITDIKPLVDNPGLSDGDWVTLWDNPLNAVSIDTYIPLLEDRGVVVWYYDSEGGCFIATAAYGTSTADEIDVLRAFRDKVLLESTLGTHLVEWYYQTSPPVADFISGNSLLKTIVRDLVIDPIVGWCRSHGDSMARLKSTRLPQPASGQHAFLSLAAL